MDVSIIIVNYNSLEVIQKCLNSIFEKTTEVEFEVIVVDNASSDGSRDSLSKDKRIKLIASNENLGFGKANNLGYNHSIGKYIFLLNPDTILLNNAVNIFFKEMERQDYNVSCIGSILKTKDGFNNHSYGVFPTNHRLVKNLLKLYFRYKTDDTTQKSFPLEVDYITGADLFIKRSVINELGFFDEDFFMYFEETDLQYRYRKAGYKSIVIEQPRIIHLEGITTKGKNASYSYRHWILYFNGYKTYMKKHFSQINYIIFRFLILFYIPAVVSRRYSIAENISILKVFF